MTQLGDLIEQLAPAAARGVDVVILTNACDVPPLTLKWRFWETRDSGLGEFKGAGYRIFVQDCDGDCTNWTLTRHGVVLAKGGTYECQPYCHFDACCLAAEAALRDDVKRRKAALRVSGENTEGAKPCG